MYVVLLRYRVIVKILGPFLLRGGWVIFLRGIVPRLATKEILAYHEIGCRKAKVIVRYVIITDPVTYEYFEPNSNEVKI